MRFVPFPCIFLLILQGVILLTPVQPALAAETAASIDARILRYPAVSDTQIAFAYAGDIWLAPKTGGLATRISSPPGEESFPRFSPDGSLLAFSGHYDGNMDIYSVPVLGGLPKRITHHGSADRMIGWYPDGKHILFASGMTTPRNRFNQLFKVSPEGGLPEKLPIPYGEFGDISPDGRMLAYIPISVDFRTWKRYRGGMNPDIWMFDLEDGSASNITQHEAADAAPMWHGEKLYFLSDRDEHKRANIWVYENGLARQVTHFDEYDVHFPSIGPSDIVFENGGRLYLLDLESETHKEVSIQVITDRATLKPRLADASETIQAAAISPTGKRAVFQARGDVFSIPAEHGIIRNITRSSGVAERHPAWSPDGKTIAYFSDRTGEYQLTLKPSDGSGEESTVTDFPDGYRYTPQWSPDSRKIVFIDQAMAIWLHDRDTESTTIIDRQLWRYHSGLTGFKVGWSADSRWIAYSKDLPNRQSAIALYDCDEQATHQITSGFYEDDLPVFDPDGDYLFYRTGRSMKPIYSDLDHTWIYANTHRLAAALLRMDVPSPLAPRNDEEPMDDEEDAEEDNASDDPENDSETGEETDEDGEEQKTDEDAPDPVEIDIEGFEQRVVILTTNSGNFTDLYATSGKLIYRSSPRTGSADGAKPVQFFDFNERETQRIIDDADRIQLSADRKTLLVKKGKNFFMIKPKKDQKLDKKLRTAELETRIDPVAEWRQIFDDAWRLQRDFFYDPNMHSVDWDAMRKRYSSVLKDAVTRWDVNYVIGELIGEMNSSHTYRRGGDTEKAPKRGVGYLGCDFTLENGAYRITKILRGASWDAENRSPLAQPGLTNFAEGDYLLAVNGEPLDTTMDPWAAFQGQDNKVVALTVNSEPTPEGATEILVETLSSEARLRYLAWVEENRQRVEAASEGRIAYVYVPDTGQGGQTELVRQYRGQVDKEGLIVDERFNSGGQIPDRFIELINRPLRNYWGVRDGADWPWPPVSLDGPKAMLINGWSGSGGDCFPYYFKQSNLGPLIGMRTWGGLIGYTGVPPLIDGGSVTVPTFGIYSTDGEWIIEGYGVDPDIEVIDDPSAMARGEDPQLERAIAEVLNRLESNPVVKPTKPAYPNRSGF